MSLKRIKSAKDVGLIVHRLSMSMLERGECDDYWTAFHQVLDSDSELKSIYSGCTQVTKEPEMPPTVSKQSISQSAGSELDRLTKLYMAQFDCTYEFALRQVLKAHQHLARKYSQA